MGGALKVQDLPSAEEVIDRVNKRFDSILYEDEDGQFKPYVCAICDHHILNEDEKQHVSLYMMKKMHESLSWSSCNDDRAKRLLRKYYKFDVSDKEYGQDVQFVKDMALSPRSVLYQPPRSGSQSAKRQYGFACCRRCGNNVNNKQTVPRNAIINKNYIGGAPKCLTELNEAELCFITPVKGYGTCLTWQGGKYLRGSLTFMSLKKEAVATASVQMQGMGLNNNMLVVYDGKMTKQQFIHAKKRSMIDPNKICTALYWLTHNNV